MKNISDNEYIESLIANRGKDGFVVLNKRNGDDGRDFYLLDRAILLPSHTTLILNDCTIKLSDRCRDNFIRSANCGLGVKNSERLYDITVKGLGKATLVGADHPRSTGDNSKVLSVPCPYNDEDLIKSAPWVTEEERQSGKLSFYAKHSHSYGTDVNNPDDTSRGDWRNIGILFANVDGFCIENIRIEESHGWAISIESCTHGAIRNIDFFANMHREIDGLVQNIENQDGIDIRNGCSYIDISDITGATGDDVIALTAIKREGNIYEAGSKTTTHVLSSDWNIRESGIHDVTIRRVKAHSSICWVIRLLATGTVIENIKIEDIVDTAQKLHHSTILVGIDPKSKYGEVLPRGLRNITIRNVEGNTRNALDIKGYLCDSDISEIHCGENGSPVLTHFEGQLDNVKIR